MSSEATFHIIIDVYVDRETDTVEIVIVREPIMACTFDAQNRPTRESLTRLEADNLGWEYFLGDEIWNQLFTGRFSVKGKIWYSQDYWGEWDMGIDIDSFEGQNRKTKRKLKAM